MAKRLLVIGAAIALLGLVPADASKEEVISAPAKPTAGPASLRTCRPGPVTTDGTPSAERCEPDTTPETAAPPVNTLEDIYGAGSLQRLLAVEPAAADPAKRAPRR